MLIRPRWLVLLLALCTGCAEGKDSHELLHSRLWMQTSAEYHVITSTTYRQAGEALDAALRDTTRTAALEQTGDFTTLPPAVILDLDETVLDNGPFEGRLIRDRTSFSSFEWDEWVEEANASALPGALEFITNARSKGVTVLFIANRQARHETQTRVNLEKLGIPLPKDFDTVFLEGEAPFNWPSDKSSRRRYVADRFRILLLIGDDLGDFVSGARDVPENRVRLARQYGTRWGTSWFLLPNPVYGSWEASLSSPALSDADRLAIKRNLVNNVP